MENQTAAVASGKEGVSYQIREVTVHQIVRTEVTERTGSVEVIGFYQSGAEAERIKALLEAAK